MVLKVREGWRRSEKVGEGQRKGWRKKVRERRFRKKASKSIDKHGIKTTTFFSFFDEEDTQDWALKTMIGCRAMSCKHLA